MIVLLNLKENYRLVRFQVTSIYFQFISFIIKRHLMISKDIKIMYIYFLNELSFTTPKEVLLNQKTNMCVYIYKSHRNPTEHQ